MNVLEKILLEKFKFPEFRGVQKPVIERLIAGKSVLSLMPTGTGKSLCYQMMAFLQNENETVLVISPLIALMQDQTQKAQDIGLRATFINSSISAEEKQKRLKSLSENKYQIIFVTPERFKKIDFVDVIRKIKISLFVVDEAHCASLWGHDFRPDYARLDEFVKICSSPRILALTATATPPVQKEICQILGLNFETDLVLGGIERPELCLNVIDLYGETEKFESMFKVMDENKNVSGIVYFTLIHTLDKFAGFLDRKKIQFTTYNGDLPPHVRRRNQKDFITGKTNWILATPAFGLGVDKPDIRFVLHSEIPSTIESYFQEVGRGGRDGKPATAILFYDQDDVSIQMQFLDWAYPESEFIRKVYLLIEKNFSQVSTQGFDYLREQMVFKNRKDFRVNAAVSILNRWGCLEEIDTKFGFKALQPPEDIFFIKENQSELKKEHQKKLLEILRWSQNTEICRMKVIYNYFGHVVVDDCGRCDVCVTA